MSERREEPKTRTWDASWEASSERQLETMLRATPAQRLVWLEEALTVAYQSGALKPRIPHL